MFATAKKLDHRLLQNLPALLEAQRAAAAERTTRRADLLRQIEQVRQQFDAKDAALIAKATPIENELAKLRARVAELEQQFLPLADARLSAMWVCNTTVKQLQADLRADAAEDLRYFDRAIDATREQIQNNGQQWSTVLGQFKPTLSKQERMKQAMLLTLEVHREAHQLAVTETDITEALERLRDRLLSAGIQLVEP